MKLFSQSLFKKKKKLNICTIKIALKTFLFQRKLVMKKNLKAKRYMVIIPNIHNVLFRKAFD